MALSIAVLSGQTVLPALLGIRKERASEEQHTGEKEGKAPDNVRSRRWEGLPQHRKASERVLSSLGCCCPHALALPPQQLTLPHLLLLCKKLLPSSRNPAGLKSP